MLKPCKQIGRGADLVEFSVSFSAECDEGHRFGESLFSLSSRAKARDLTTLRMITQTAPVQSPESVEHMANNMRDLAPDLGAFGDQCVPCISNVRFLAPLGMTKAQCNEH